MQVQIEIKKKGREKHTDKNDRERVVGSQLEKD